MSRAVSDADAAPVPTALPDSVTQIEHGGTTYYIVGTAHVSQRSVDEVRSVIDAVQPDVVCVELDKNRHEALTKDSAFRDLDVFKVVKEGRTLYLLAHLALGAYQRRIGSHLGVKPGAELLAAVNMATKRNIPVELIDRDINITLKRTWANLGLWKRSMLLSSLLVGWDDGEADKVDVVSAKTIEDLKEPKALSEMLAELGAAVPQIKGPLIDERDRYLATRAVAAGQGRKKVVAVVGAAHVPGMKANWGVPADLAALDKIPPPGIVWRALKWLVPALFLLGIVWFWQSGTSGASLYEMMMAWVLPTSIGAGALTLLTGGSPFSVAAALLVAPVAAIHPLLGTGMVVGVVEAWRRKPSVVDCERLPEDIESGFRGYWRNPVTRILIITVASGLGTAAGFWIGVAWVAKLV